MAMTKLWRIIVVKESLVMATTQVVSEVVSSPPPPTPPSVLLRTDWLFRNAERKGKAGQIFQAEVVPIRGLEPVNEGCPKEREGKKEGNMAKLQGRLILFRKRGQAPRIRVHRDGFTCGENRAAGASAGRAGAWLCLGAWGSSLAGPGVRSGTRRGAWTSRSSAPGARRPSRPRGTQRGAHAPGPGALLARRPLPPGLRRGKAGPREAGLQQPGRL